MKPINCGVSNAKVESSLPMSQAASSLPIVKDNIITVFKTQYTLEVDIQYA